MTCIPCLVNEFKSTIMILILNSDYQTWYEKFQNFELFFPYIYILSFIISLAVRDIYDLSKFRLPIFLLQFYTVNLWLNYILPQELYQEYLPFTHRYTMRMPIFDGIMTNGLLTSFIIIIHSKHFALF